MTPTVLLLSVLLLEFGVTVIGPLEKTNPPIVSSAIYSSAPSPVHAGLFSCFGSSQSGAAPEGVVMVKESIVKARQAITSDNNFFIASLLQTYLCLLK